MKNLPIAVFAAVAAFAAKAAVKSAADYDVGDYVQDGLIAHYDGIRNAGATLPHDSEAAKWADLVNAGVYASRENILSKSNERLGVWTGKSFRFEGNSCMVMSAPITLGADFTISAVFDLDLDSERAVNEGRVYPTVFSCSTNDTLTITMNRSWATPIAKTNVFWKTDICSSTGSSTGRPTIDPFYGKYINAAFDSALDRNYLSQTSSFTKSGSYQANKADQSVGAMAYSWGGRAGVKSTGLVGEYHALRIYSRKLSDEELARNMMVDEIRFRGGAIPNTNVVVEASVYAGVGGVEAAGVYEVVGSHTFTAPDVTVGGTIYRAAGYTIETWNGKFWSSAKRFEGGSYTYTVSEDSPTVRLTWLWKAVRGIRAMSDYDACDYVQGALIAQYDGIRNAGAELAHNPGAAVWQDLKSPDNYMTFNGTTDVAAATGEWAGGNAYKFNGFSYARMAQPINLGSNITVQLAVDIDNAAQERNYNTLFAGWLGYPLYFSAEKDSGPFAKVYHDHDSQGRCLEWKDSGETGSGASTGRAKLYSWNYKYITAVTTDERAYLFEEDDYCADESLSGSPKSFVRTKWKEFKDYRWSVGGASYENPDEVNKRLTIGMYHSARFYNRPLTSEELIWNRKVDEIRFRGAAYTNVVVASSKAKAEGVQKNGTYEVLGEGVFSAVAVNTVKGGRNVTYIPTGYTIERLSGGEWSVPETYVGTSYTYDVEKENGQIVRLTWMWRSEGLGTVITIK